MKSRPILFSAPMVRAILDGHKHQTRRVVVHEHIAEADIFSKAADDQGRWEFGVAGEGGVFAHGDFIRCPYGVPGDTLLVVELRSIPGADPKYQAGSDGRIYSWSGGNTNARKEKPFALRHSVSSTGYPTVTLTGSQRRGSVAVHALICAAFHGEPTKAAAEVRHLDGDKSNAKPDNLQWGTRAENEADKRRHRTLATGSRHGASKLNDDDVALIRKAVGIGLVTANRAAEFYGILPSTIRDIANGRTWRDIEAPSAPPPPYTHIRLSVEAVRVQRLQEISEDDARAEGVEPGTFGGHRAAFVYLWDSINGKRAPWSSNAWVWAITFRRFP